MDDEQVIPASSNTQDSVNDEKKQRPQSPIMAIGIIVLVAGLAIFAYLLGSKNGSSEKVDKYSPTPTLKITEIPSDAPSPTLTSSQTPTPTKKPTSTPTPSLTPTPTVKVKVLSSSSSLDGFRSSNNGGNDTLEIRAGRNDTLVTRGFISFGISDIPSGSTITEASLRLYQKKVDGTPYTAGGNLVVDHLNYGDSLDYTDYGMAALVSGFATLTSNPTVEWKDVSVTAQVKDDLANARSRSQYRIHFSTEVTGGTPTGDFVYFESADNSMGTGNTPQLIVKYY